MPKINVYLPDELAEAVKESGVPVSAICQRALEQAVRRVTAIRETTLGETDRDDPTSTLTQFTTRARTAINLGVSQAREEGAASLGTGHLLAGLLAEGQNLALQVLRAMEIDPEAVRRELTRQAPKTPPAEEENDSSGSGGGRRFSRTAANALELTVTEATSLGHNYVGCEHLLLGLVAEPDGTAGHVLRGLGADYRLTRRAVTAALAGYVHLRAQSEVGAGAATGTDPAAALRAALTQQLQPIVERLERLERRIEPQGDTGIPR
ncbi:Clp protease N-terminal domain-containing protein [Micromonospora sp. NPDC050397]|uniref:Clp protease N-terminal domain-containing protein n=1 Tax=Micromonospora sp. NPDC050397 TaxID=3364279 RepID=UPI00384C5DD5